MTPEPPAPAPQSAPQPTQTLAAQIDSLDEKLTMIMDHLGIQPMETDDAEAPPEGQSTMDQITSSKGE